MKMKHRRNTNQDKGFTLVELIISMVILSIVILIVASFLSIGTRSYSRADSEIKSQMESQTVMNQLEDLIMEADWVELKDIDAGRKALIIYDGGEINIVLNHTGSDENSLYLVEGTSLDLSDLSSITYSKEENLMADNVCGLELLVNSDEMKTKNMMKLKVDFIVNGKIEPQIKNIYFRNKLAEPTRTP